MVSLLGAADKTRARIEVRKQARELSARLVQNIYRLQAAVNDFAQDPNNEEKTESVSVTTRHVFLLLIQLKKVAPDTTEFIGGLTKEVTSLRNSLEGMRDAYVAVKQAEAALALTSESVISQISTVVADVASTAAEANRGSQQMKVLVIVLAVLGGGIVAWTTTSLVLRSVRGIINMMQSMRDGNYDLDVKGQDRKDEFGSMLRAIEIFRKDGLDKIRLRKEQEEVAAQAASDRRDLVLGMANRLEQQVQTVAADIGKAAGEVQESCGLVTGQANQVEELTEQVSKRS